MKIRTRTIGLVGVLAILIGLTVGPVVGRSAPRARPYSIKRILGRVSQPVVIRYLLQHPQQAPAQLGPAFSSALAGVTAPAGGRAPSRPAATIAGATVFNGDNAGLPQNEESVAVCRSNNSKVLGGTNDYRGLLSGRGGNIGGFHYSNDSGNTMKIEGLLPPVSVGGDNVPSGGDPVVAADAACNFYATNINYTLRNNGATKHSAVSLYRSPAGRLNTCSSVSSCWPKKRVVVATSLGYRFLDKEWMDVGESGPAGRVVWVTYTDFNNQTRTSQIKGVRCKPDLSKCTSPTLISGNDKGTQFSYVTIGPDGRVYVTWLASAVVNGKLVNSVKIRIAPPGSTNFGATRIVANINPALPRYGLHAADFRTASIPKNAVSDQGTQSHRTFVTYDECTYLVAGACEEPRVRVVWSDNDFATQPGIHNLVLSKAKDNFFSTIAFDPDSKQIVVSWYTTGNDDFHHRYDVEMSTFAASSPPANSGAAPAPTRITEFVNEPDADPFLGGSFIGDYFQVVADGGTAWNHFNANYRSTKLLGGGVPVPQQDNYLARTVFFP